VKGDNTNPQQKSGYRLQQVVTYRPGNRLQAATSGDLPTWGPPQGRNTNIHPSVGPAKGAKKAKLHTSGKTALL
jgi:hypothetical protein